MENWRQFEISILKFDSMRGNIQFYDIFFN